MSLVQLSLWSDYSGRAEARPYDTTVIQELRWLNRRCGPVSAAHLAGFIGKSPRMAQYMLNRLAAAGTVQRVGVRGGWVVKREGGSDGVR